MKSLITLLVVAIAAGVVYFSNGIGSEQSQDARPVSDVDLNKLLGSDDRMVIGDIDVDLAKKVVDGLGTGPAESKKKYDRVPQFGEWKTGENSADTDFCGDTRDDVLNRDLDDVKYKTDNKCQVASGTLATDLYTDRTIPFTRGVSTSMDVQIDHMIPLKRGWLTGAEGWTQEKRIAFANDPENLIAVDGPANGSKSDSGPGDWMPENEEYACTYVSHYAYVANKYELHVEASDKRKMEKVLSTCDPAAEAS